MHLLDLRTSAKYALIVPKILQIVAANPLIRTLELICHSCHEAVLFGQVLLKLLSCNQCIPKQLELVCLNFEKILEDHGPLGRIASDQIESHVIVIRTRILISEALLLSQCIDVA